MRNPAKWFGIAWLLTSGLAGVHAAPADVRLIDAVKKADVTAVRSLIAQRVDLNAADADGSTALHWAARLDRPEIVDLLAAAGANAARRDALQRHAALARRRERKRRHHRAPVEGGSRPERHVGRRPDRADDRVAHRTGGRDEGAARSRRQRAHARADQRTDRVDVGGIGRQRRRRGSAGRVRRRSQREIEGRLDELPVRRAQRPPRGGEGPAEARRQRQRRRARRHQRAEHGRRQRLLRTGVGAARSRRRSECCRTNADRRCTPWPGCENPGADGAAGVGNTPHGPPVPTGNVTAFELAKKLLEHGANPNVRIKWEEKKFDKEGGTMKNPPLIQLGRHYLTYVGATPFYVAAHNGDAPYMRLLAEHGADPKMPNVLGITPLIAAAGLDYWEGEAPGPFTGCSEAERLDAVKLALESGERHQRARRFRRLPDGRRSSVHPALLPAEHGSTGRQGARRSPVERQHRAARRGGLRTSRRS